MKAFLTVLFFLFPSTLYATEACQLMSHAEFKTEIIAKSELIALVEVEDFSEVHQTQSGWTKLQIKKSFKGRIAASEITIKKWQAVFPPLYDYPKGTALLVFLTRNADGYDFSDLSWTKCSPSIANIYQGKVYFSYEGHPGTSLEQLALELVNDPG